jgi:hypothetical protein
MPTYIPKPKVPIWNPALGPAGTRSFWPLTERDTLTAKDVVSRRDATFLSSPAWVNGLYGPQLDAIATGNYPLYSGAVPTMVYPRWIAGLGVCTASGAKVICSIEDSASGGYVRLQYNSSNRIHFVVSPDGVATAQVLTTATAAFDGNPHVIMGVEWHATSRALYFDGNIVGTINTTSSGAIQAYNRISLGATVAGGSRLTAGNLIAAAYGQGAQPDPMKLAVSWLDGRFLELRPRWRTVFWAGSVFPPEAPPAGSALPSVMQYGSFAGGTI